MTDRDAVSEEPMRDSLYAVNVTGELFLLEGTDLSWVADIPAEPGLYLASHLSNIENDALVTVWKPVYVLSNVAQSLAARRELSEEDAKRLASLRAHEKMLDSRRHLSDVVFLLRLLDAPSERAKPDARSREKIFDHKWLDPKCIETGCQSLLLTQTLAALSLLEVAETEHANCPECEGEGIPELCGRCFPFFDAARLARRAAVAGLPIATTAYRGDRLKPDASDLERAQELHRLLDQYERRHWTGLIQAAFAQGKTNARRAGESAGWDAAAEAARAYARLGEHNGSHWTAKGCASYLASHKPTPTPEDSTRCR